LKHKRFKAFLFFCKCCSFDHLATIWRPERDFFYFYARFASIVSSADAALLSLSSKA